jgi:aminocarboxymuconate-semialdehyde decarboxylase
MKRIDMHSHIIPLSTLGGAGEYGPEYLIDDKGTGWIRVGENRRPFETIEGQAAEAAGMSKRAVAEKWLTDLSDPHVRLADMDSKNIDVVGVTISPLFYFYWIEESIAIPFAAQQNDAMHEYCQTNPARFFMQATLPLQNIAESIREAERAVTELGAKSINIGAANLGGREMYDRAFYPLWEKVCQLGVPLFIHPYPVELAASSKEKYIRGVLDYPYQETVAFTNLAYGGVFDDFPSLRLYLPHGGGFIPYQFGRIESFGHVKPGVVAKKPLREYLNNVYFDIHIHELAARRFLVEWAGLDRLVVGDNYQGVDSADGFAFLEELGLSDEDNAKIAWRNSAELFALDIAE